MKLPSSAPPDKSRSSLRSRIFSATLWTLLLRVVTRVLGIAATIVVARLIPQSELGTFGIIIIPDAGLQALTMIGFSTALVQMKQDPGPYLDTVWTFEVVRGIVLFLVKVALAPLWCRFFNVPDATSAMQVLACGQLLMGCHSISTSTLTRDLRFDRLFFIYASETLAYTLFTIPAAWLLRDRWALVYGLNFAFAVRVVVSYLVSPVRARFRFELARAKEMLRFAGWLTGFSVADFFLETTDNAIAGRMLGRVALARYRMAYQFSTEGPQALQWVVSRVGLPALARVQAEAGSIQANFRAMLGVTAVTMAPITAGTVALGGLLIPLLLGPQWSAAVRPLEILVVAGFLRSVIDSASPMLRALGRTRADFLLRVVQVGTLCSLLYPAAKHFGINGVAAAVLLAAVVTLPFFVWTLRVAARLEARDFLLPLLSPIVASIGALLLLRLLPAPPTSWVALLGYGAVFSTIYVGLSYLLHRVIPGSGLGAVMRETGG